MYSICILVLLLLYMYYYVTQWNPNFSRRISIFIVLLTNFIINNPIQFSYFVYKTIKICSSPRFQAATAYTNLLAHSLTLIFTLYF